MKPLFILAQADLSSAPAEIFKWVIIIGLGLILVGGVVVGIIVAFRKQTVAIDPQPVEVRKSAKRFNHDLQEERHGNMSKRIDGHEERIAALEEMTSGMEGRILLAGEQREQRLQNQLNQLPGEIIATLVNAKKLND